MGGLHTQWATLRWGLRMAPAGGKLIVEAIVCPGIVRSRATRTTQETAVSQMI